SRLAAAGVPVGTDLPVDGVPVDGLPAFLARREEVLRDAPPITVVVCTRERPEPLARCLDSLLGQQYPRFRVLVVDNAPATDATERVVREAANRGLVDYLVAPLPGLSHARNAAVAAAGGETLAWLDDDEVADPFWLAEVARALADHPEADVVSGVIVPAELETRAQVWFEQFGGHSKGRGFVPAVFSPATAHLQSPLYPLPPFGTGANMTFRPGVIESIGGFDPALGAGTPAMGSEDTLAFTQVLRRGGTIAYQPSAVTWHYHRRDLDGLRRQMVGYGAGLTAAYLSLVLADPKVLVPLIRLVPTALRDLTADDSLRSAGLEADFPRELMGANRRGMLSGPFLYLRGRLRNRRLRSALGGS
ncbi:MAG: glycosyl transferase family 2 protein, partial [Dactylosporangium sp.]|nr:glycosyl transferase family 2 protein [Dactylosporangium sp.]